MKDKQEIASEIAALLDALTKTGMPVQIGIVMFLVLADFADWITNEDAQKASTRLAELVAEAEQHKSKSSKHDNFDRDVDFREEKSAIDALPPITTTGSKKTH